MTYSEALALAESPDDVAALMRAAREELESDWEAWLRYLFPQHVRAPFAPHHVEFWGWVWAIEAGADVVPFVGIWPRGGAKSSSAELAVAALGARRRRSYVLWVCGIQDRADDHVTNIGGLLESPRVADLYPELGERLVNNFGYSRGWRVNRLRSASGFTVDAIGLDKATRGVKLDEQRPDLIVFDDIDGGTDSPRVTESKVAQITRAFLPALAQQGGTVLAMQNLVLANGVFARIAGSAEQEGDFLQDRILSGPLPAAHDLVLGKDDEGKDTVLAGEPIWEGQDLATMQTQIRRMGRTAFLIEAQHEVELRSGGTFRAWEWLPQTGWASEGFADSVPRCRAWDQAGTEFDGKNDPDWTVGVLWAFDPETSRYRIEDVVRFRHAAGARDSIMRSVALEDQAAFGDRCTQLIERRPGDLGRDEADRIVREVWQGVRAEQIPAMTSKVDRADGLASAMQNRLVSIVAQDPDLAQHRTGTRAFIAEHEGFPLGDHDDQVDAAAHGFNWLRKRGNVSAGSSAGRNAQLHPLRR